MLSQSDDAIVQIIEEHVEVGKLDQWEEVDQHVTGGNTDHTLKLTVSLKPISSDSLKSVIDSCCSDADEQIAVGYAISISISKLMMLY